MLALGGTPLPVASLAETLGLRARETLRTSGKTPAVVVAAGDRRVALVVDDFLAEQEVVVKNLGARAATATRFSGNHPAFGPDRAGVEHGQRDPHGVTTSAVHNADAAGRDAGQKGEETHPRCGRFGHDPHAGEEYPRSGRLRGDGRRRRSGRLATTPGTRHRSDCQRRRHAADGRFRSDGDSAGVENGFAELPVVLVTAGKPKRTRRGIAVRADAYLGKSGFDQKNLLETIAQLL